MPWRRIDVSAPIELILPYVGSRLGGGRLDTIKKKGRQRLLRRLSFFCLTLYPVGLSYIRDYFPISRDLEIMAFTTVNAVTLAS